MLIFKHILKKNIVMKLHVPTTLLQQLPAFCQDKTLKTMVKSLDLILNAVVNHPGMHMAEQRFRKDAEEVHGVVPLEV